MEWDPEDSMAVPEIQAQGEIPRRGKTVRAQSCTFPWGQSLLHAQHSLGLQQPGMPHTRSGAIGVSWAAIFCTPCIPFPFVSTASKFRLLNSFLEPVWNRKLQVSQSTQNSCLEKSGLAAESLLCPVTSHSTASFSSRYGKDYLMCELIIYGHFPGAIYRLRPPSRTHLWGKTKTLNKLVDLWPHKNKICQFK